MLSLTGSLLKKASDLLGLNSPELSSAPPLDGEIIYCKNNVCVHPPTNLISETSHHPGYLNIRSQLDPVLGTTLILTWIPNSNLKRNPRSLENSPGQPRVSPHRLSPRPEFAKSDWEPSQEAASAEEQCSGYGERRSFTRRSEQTTEALSERLSNTPFSSNDDDDSKEEGKITLEEDIASVRKNWSVSSVEMDGDQIVVVAEHSSPHSPFYDQQSTLQHSSYDCQATDASSCTKQTDIPDNGQVDIKETNITNEYDSQNDKHKISLLKQSLGLNLEQKCFSSQVTTTDSQNSSQKSHSHKVDNNDAINKDLEPHEQISSKAISDQANTTSVENYEGQNLSTNDISHDEQRDSSLSPTHSTSTATSGPDSTLPSPVTPPEYGAWSETMRTSPEGRMASDQSTSGSGVESPYALENMQFPSSAVAFERRARSQDPPPPPHPSAAEQICGVFSVDIGQMRSLRLFYTDGSAGCGQLVIASRESQYKILHFHHGGLDHLGTTLNDWHFLTTTRSKKRGGSAVFRQFSVVRPHETHKERHPEEGAHAALGQRTWQRHMKPAGQIADDFHLRKVIFFGGVEAGLRHEVWPFLLHYYPYSSTREQRQQLRNDRFLQYQQLRKAREDMTDEEMEKFWRNVQCIVEKDVVRTDRSHAYFKGHHNPNIEVLKQILLNYAVAYPECGYTQGMSDLLAPVLAELQNEADAFWCFTGLMQSTIFVSSPTDSDMDKQLGYLRELLRVSLPRFYRHARSVRDGLELLFVHRWLLLCFKREFHEAEALAMWEACWAHYQTDFFHLFICLAIISVYGEDVIEEKLGADDMLLHFSSLSMHMNGKLVLTKARAMLHTFRTRPTIPCTLVGLCRLCSSGMWDSGHVPTVTCVRKHPDGTESCPYGGTIKQ